MRHASVSARPGGQLRGPGARQSPARPSPARPRTSILGRDGEIPTLIELLRDPASRVVSITGRSGAGKTRLALEVAARLRDEFPGGAVVIDASAVDDPGLIPSSLAAALGLRMRPGQPAEDALRLRLEREPTLVLADDIDHVRGGAEALLEITDGCPGTRLLVTAQVPLRLEAERVVRLGPLGLPAPGPASISSLRANPAVALFCERAAAVDHTFELVDDNTAAVVELCRRLDGLPLAIELAAARTKILPVAAQLEVLERGSSLDLRPPDREGRSARHQELRAAIAWTFGLAAEAQRRLLRRMGVFEAGCGLEALRAVCAEPGENEADLLDALMALVDIHLVEPELDGPSARFRLLPTIREYAREQLNDVRETTALTDRHTDWLAAFAAGTREVDERTQVAALTVERDDLHAALDRLVQGGDLGRALALVADVAPLWLRHGYFPRAQEWLEGLLGRAAEAGVEDEAHARVLLWAVLFGSYQRFDPDLRGTVVDRLDRGAPMARSFASVPARLFGLRVEVLAVFVTHDLPRAAAAAREGYELAASTGEEGWLTRFEYLLAMAAQQAGDVEAAAALGAVSLRRATRRRDTLPIIWAGMLLHALPPGTRGLPDALPTYQSLIALARESGDLEAEMALLARLATLAVTTGDTPRGARHAIEGIELARRTASWGMAAFSVVALVIAAAGRGDDETAAGLHGSIAPILDEVRMGLAPSRAASYVGLIEDVRQRLGADRFDGAAGDAVLLDWDSRLAAAADYARTIVDADVVATASRTGGVGAVEATSLIEPLTHREIDVLRQLATGGSNKEIAIALGLRPKTVMHHSVSIYGKLGVRGRAEATAWAFRHGLMNPPVDGASPLN